MRYFSGKPINLGDKVKLDKDSGIVVAIIHQDRYLQDYQSFSYLEKGVLIEFEKYGLIYYEDELEPQIELNESCFS